MEMTCQLIENRLLDPARYGDACRIPHLRRYRDFGEYDPHSPENILAFCRALPPQAGRVELAQVLPSANAELGGGEECLANARRLADGHTFAIMAGHQPVLFGGPLFILLKIATIVALARELNARGGGLAFVPVFWNASEDHNLAEIGRCALFSPEGELRHLTLPPQAQPLMAGAYPVQSLLPLIDEMRALLPQTEFTAGIIEELQGAATGDLGGMFSRLLLRWFSREGLVVVEPRMLRALPVVRGVIADALRDSATHHTLLHEDSEAVRALGFSAQLPADDPANTPVFLLRDGQRLRIVREEGSFCAGDARFTLAEILDMLHTRPEDFSPAATLRPVVQAAALPVAVYAAGGGEHAYHLQLRKIFRHYNRTLPLLLPRAGATVITRSQEKNLRRLRIAPEELLGGGWDWPQVEGRFAAELAGIDAAFAGFGSRFAQAEEELTGALNACGIDNLNEWLREKERFMQRLAGLQARLRQQSPATGGAARERLLALRRFILPRGHTQDLTIAGMYFYALSGPEFFAKICGAVNPVTHLHHLLTIG